MREEDIQKEFTSAGSALYQLQRFGLEWVYDDYDYRLTYPVGGKTLIRLEVIADNISFVRTLATGEIHYIDLAEIDSGNSLLLQVMFQNTDTFSARFLLAIEGENCMEGILITPYLQVEFSLDHFEYKL